MDTAARLALVEEDIIRQKLVLSRLCSQKNSFSFVSRLPNETLADIFIHCARDYYYHSEDHRCYAPPSWFNVSYVCRHWRNIALNCPTLWTHITIIPPSWMEELLERSKKASLKIRNDVLDLDVLRFLGSIKKMMVDVARIQELQLTIPSRYADQVFATLSSRAPRLQNLKISTPIETSSSLFVLFDGDTPSLRSLELENVRVPFFLLNTRSLRTLRLHRASGPFQDIKDFLSTLGYMDRLTHLWLDHAFPCCREFVFSPTFNASQKLRLPHLSQLLIRGPISTITALLSGMNFPLKAEVRLDYRFEYGDSPEEHTLFTSVLARKYTGIMSTSQELSIPAIRSLVIEFTGRRRRLTCSTSDRGHNFDHPPIERLGWDHNVPLQISLPCSWTDIDHMTSDICRSLPLTHLENVHVIESPDSSDFWKCALGHLQELRYMKLSGGYMPNLTSMLAVEPDCGSTNHHAVQMFAPALEVLELHDVTFPVRLAERTFDEPCLREALATRKEPQVQLRIMDRCYEDWGSEDESEVNEDISDPLDLIA